MISKGVFLHTPSYYRGWLATSGQLLFFADVYPLNNSDDCRVAAGPWLPTGKFEALLSGKEEKNVDRK